ncbi:Cytochrome P450 2A3 [Lemmus lemmus]
MLPLFLSDAFFFHCQSITEICSQAQYQQQSRLFTDFLCPLSLYFSLFPSSIVNLSQLYPPQNIPKLPSLAASTLSLCLCASGNCPPSVYLFLLFSNSLLGNSPRVVSSQPHPSSLTSPCPSLSSPGVVFSTGERAKQLRRFSIATLRDFGVGKRGIEERIQEEAGFLLEAFQKTNGALIDPTFYLSRTVSNVISSIVFGDRFDYEDKEFLSLLRMMLGIFQFTSTSTGQLYEMFSSVMKYLPGPQQQAFKELKGLEDFITKKVKQNQSTLDPNSPRDFIDSFLIRMQEKKNPNTEFYMKNLVFTTVNLFFAGTETVSTTLRFGFLLLMKHPDVQAKVQEEIDRVIGKNRQPKYEDRLKMPYTEAVIHEIQRFGDMIPMGISRRVTKDTKFRDFLIPKVFT